MGIAYTIGKGTGKLSKFALKNSAEGVKFGAKQGYNLAKKLRHENTLKILKENPIYSSILLGYNDMLVKAPEDISSYNDLRKKAKGAAIFGGITTISYLSEDVITNLVRHFHDIGHEELTKLVLGEGHNAVHHFMDSAVGYGHRDFGHGIFYLDNIYDKFGLEGVEAAILHNLQDFTTDHGIPIIFDISLNLARMITSVAFILFSYKTYGLIKEWNVDRKIKSKCKQARKLVEKKRYDGAINMYDEAFGLKRGNPRIDLAKGYVYLIADKKEDAFVCFDRAALYFGPDEFLDFNKARISARGVSALSAYGLKKEKNLENIAIDGFIRLGNNYRKRKELSAALNYYYAFQLTKDNNLLDTAVKSLARISKREKENATLINLVIYAWSKEAL